jgi:hypothetical protein
LGFHSRKKTKNFNHKGEEVEEGREDGDRGKETDEKIYLCVVSNSLVGFGCKLLL